MTATMTACASDDAGEVVNTQEPTDVLLTFSPYEVSAMTRAAVADYATRLDVWIVNGGDTIAVQQTKDDAGFASLQVTLDKRKTYALYAVAHKGTAAATLSEGVVTFPDNKVTHSFWYTTTFTPSETTSLHCLMDRIVGQFRVETTDAVPDEVASFDIHIGQSPTAWSVTAGGVNVQDRHASFPTYTTKADGTIALSCFIIATASEATAYTLTVTAYDEQGGVVQERVFVDVPVRNGYRSTYRGAFFTDEDFAASFTVNDWTDYEVVEF